MVVAVVVSAETYYFISSVFAPFVLGRSREKRDAHSITVFYMTHSGIDVFLFELVDRLSVGFEVDRRAVFWIFGFVLFSERLGFLVVVSEERVFEKETKRRHAGNEECTITVQLEDEKL